MAALLLAACGGSQPGPATVHGRVVTGIAVTPATANLALGLSLQLSATASYSDGTTADVTSLATWESGTPAAVAVSAAGVVTAAPGAAAGGASAIAARLGGVSGAATITLTPAVLTAVAVAPGSVALVLGLAAQLTATARYSDGTSRDVTGQVTWTSARPAAIAVSAGGAVSAGPSAVSGSTANVTAALGGITASVLVTVAPPVAVALSVTPSAASLGPSSPLQLTAIATYSDGSTLDVTSAAAWTSATPASVAVGSTGLVSAAPGAVAGSSSAVTAIFGGASATSTVTLVAVTVTAVAVTPGSATLPAGLPVQLTATATSSDGSTSDVTALASWTSGTTASVTVSRAGVAQSAPGAAVGSTSVVRAAYGGMSGATLATVVAAVPVAIAIAPSAASLRLGRSQQLLATATYSDATRRDVTAQASWASATPASVLVSASGMAATAPGSLAGGAAVVTASFGGASGTADVTLSPAAAPIGPGLGGDPLSPQQWHLANSGQTGYADVAGIAGNDLGLAATYQAGYRGAGVKVAVVDTGLELLHEDLAANVVPGSWNFLDATPDPTSTATYGDHGTSVAGLIAMVYGNGIGGMGVAPGASLNGYNFLSSDQSTAYYVASLGGSAASPASQDVWVFNESYCYNNTVDFLVDPTVEAQLRDGVTSLRGGRGALYVKAAGDGFQAFGTAACALANSIGVPCQNANMDPENTLPYNIVVGAVNAAGVRSSYSTAGSSLWVSAPGGEFGLNAAVYGSGGPAVDYEPAMITTDQSGCARGYSRDLVNTSSFNNGQVPNGACNYTSTFNGTSSAAPLTSGAIALILEANPTLSWRDVKDILATTATQVDPGVPAVTDFSIAGGPYVAELPWITNAAGYRFHNWYGFGRLDVDAAVAMAATYRYGRLGALADTGWISSGALSLPIPDDDAAGVTSSVTVPATPARLTIEAVQVSVTARHGYSGDLGVELTSPSGTRSILLNIKNGFASTTGLAGMVLESNAFYGEASAGAWTIKVVDGTAGHTGTLTNWQIRVFGH